MTEDGTDRTALVVAHPGHELRVHGWLERARPLVFVLTDGSGHLRRSRLSSSRSTLERAGAREGSIFGRFTDAEIYSLILAGDPEPFCEVVRALSDALSREEIDYVAGDAAEGFNPSHDLCRHLIDAAVRLSAQARPGLRSFDFLLDGPPGERDHGARDALVIQLDASAFDRKLRAARAYEEMQDETNAAVARFGAAAFAQEVLCAVDARRELLWSPSERPFYEVYGERQVARGYYGDVIRHREHMIPLALRIWERLGITAVDGA